MQKLVFFQGSFDILNAGHVRAFALAKLHGDTLVVGLNTDELIERDKNRKVILPYEQRKEIIESLKPVDLVIPCDQELALPYLVALNADVFVLTKEWEERHKDTGIKYMQGKGGEIVFSPRWPDIMCSSDIRRKVIETGR